MQGVVILTIMASGVLQLGACVLKNKAVLPLKLRLFIVGLLLVVFAIFTAGPASAECAKFPSVPWWSGTTHDTVKRYVNIKNGGNWSAYIKKWENQLKFLRKVESKKGTAVVANYRLRGTSLKQYVEKVAARVSISRCLASQSSGNMPASKRVDPTSKKADPSSGKAD